MPDITKAETDNSLFDKYPEIQSDPRHKKHYYFHATLFRRFFVGLIELILKLFARYQVSGIEHLPAEGPLVMASNHLTNLDVFPIQIALRRTLFFMAKAELHANWFTDWFFRTVGAFPVQRGQRDYWAIAHAAKVLEKGKVLAIFPEGTRSKGRGLRSAKTGAARFSIQANCPILPVAITGTHHIFKTFPRRALVTITIGEPLYPQPGESALALTDRLMFTIAEMLPKALRGVYAERPVGFG